MWSRVRGWAAVTGVLAAVLLTAACHMDGPQASAAASPSPTNAAKSSAPATSAPATAGRVVALGDSYTAGALLPVDSVARPPGCLRSTKAYPVLVAQALHAQLTDVACTNAGVKEMTGPQQTYLGTNPAQLAALKPGDRLVLLSLGGDDLGFLNVLQECMKVSVAAPSGSPCKAHYTVGGTDQLAAGVTTEAAKIARVLSGIRERAPQARVVVVGYPDMFRSPAVAGPPCLSPAVTSPTCAGSSSAPTRCWPPTRRPQATRSRTPTRRRSAMTSARRSRFATLRDCSPARWPSRSTRT